MTTATDAAPRKLEGAALIHSLKMRLGTAALAGALIPLAVAGMAAEAAAKVEEQQPPTDPLGRKSDVVGTVSTAGPPFDYSFQVFNRTPFTESEEFPSGRGGIHLIVDWELPLFSLNGINLQSIRSPQLWTYEIIVGSGDDEGRIVADDPNFNNDVDDNGFSDFYNNDDSPYGEYSWDWRAENDPVFFADNDVYGTNPDQFQDPAFILHWYTTLIIEIPTDDEDTQLLIPGAIFEGDSLADFGFEALASGTNAPYQASWFQNPQTIGDPPTPLGGAIGVPNNAAVPEPGMLALFATGLLGLFGLRRRRQSV